MQTALIVLAAGGSKRLGESKQLLKYQGKTLLAASLEAALDCGKHPVICVLSAQSSKEEVAQAPFAASARLTLVDNPHWSQGISTSIRCALTCALEKYSDLTAALFMTCDQPHVTEAVLTNLLDKFAAREAGIEIAASAYASTLGIPAVFAGSLFARLLALEGDKGAKAIILQNKDSVLPVPFAQGHIDIDTRQEYERLINQ